VHGEVDLLYADWTATGRLYAPLERRIAHDIGPFVGNTHSESSETGCLMTQAYHAALHRIREHINAGPDDIVLAVGAGTTAAVNKLQRIMGLRLPPQSRAAALLPAAWRPVVFVTHMEHHSNHISWRETTADVVLLEPGRDGLVDPAQLERQLRVHGGRRRKIGAFSACSNVTGIRNPYRELARIMHSHGGLCFVDFAASAAYDPIDLHPADDPLGWIDAAYFSPHKFLGGPGSAGVLVFNRALHRGSVPDDPGGGTVAWTSPWGHRYVPDLREREDGGTPGFLQAIRAALAIDLKEQMRPELMREREDELLERLLRGLEQVPGIEILASGQHERLGIVSINCHPMHYNLLVRVLSDRYGIQVRGGCSCAGSYGHYLLRIGQAVSRRITDRIDAGDLSAKPGWVRISLHPTMTEGEVDRIVDAVREAVGERERWEGEYTYHPTTNEWSHPGARPAADVAEWLRL